MNKYAGIGFRRDLADAITNDTILKPAFIELAPENWMEMGGFWKKKLIQAVEKFQVTSHGLSLSLGSPEELDWEFIKKVKN